MREIKFRGKRIDNKKIPGCIFDKDGWVWGYYYHEDDKDFIIFPQSGHLNKTIIMKIEVHPDTVGQYTGLKDRKDVKIYEGDQYYEGKNNNGRKMWTVKWAVAGFMGDYANGSGQRYINYEDIEIIGNIHQNGDLLNGK